MNQEEAKRLFDYNPETGIVIRKTGPRKGLEAGGKSQKLGYRSIIVDGKKYQIHRIIFLIMEGEFPPHQVDHINGIRDDNRWINLRKVTNAENQRNTKLNNTNTSGYNGVYSNGCGNFSAYVSLGTFDTLEEAVEAKMAFDIIWKEQGI